MTTENTASVTVKAYGVYNEAMADAYVQLRDSVDHGSRFAKADSVIAEWIKSGLKSNKDAGGVPADNGVRIIDFGCGAGHLTRYLSQHVTDVGLIVGVDPSQPMIQRCIDAVHRNGGGDSSAGGTATLQYLVGDVCTDVNFRDRFLSQHGRRFQFALSQLALMQLPLYDQLVAFLQAMFDVLEPRGKTVIQVPVLESYTHIVAAGEDEVTHFADAQWTAGILEQLSQLERDRKSLKVKCSRSSVVFDSTNYYWTNRLILDAMESVGFRQIQLKLPSNDGQLNTQTDFSVATNFCLPGSSGNGFSSTLGRFFMASK